MRLLDSERIEGKDLEEVQVEDQVLSDRVQDHQVGTRQPHKEIS